MNQVKIGWAKRELSIAEPVSIPGQMYLLKIYSFPQEILTIAFRRREMHFCDMRSQNTVDFFRERRILIICSKPGFYMTNRNLLIERGKCCCHTCSGIAMYQNKIRPTLCKNIAHTCQHPCRHIGQVLTALHYIQVKIWCDFKQSQHLIKHFTMLSSNTDYCLEVICMLLKLLYQRAHFNCLWTGSKNKHYCLFHYLPLI